MKNKKRKSLFVALTLVLLSGLASVSSTFAWWNTLSRKELHNLDVANRVVLKVEEIVSGVGDIVPSTVDSTNLVDGQVQELNFNYKVSITDDKGYLKTVEEGITTYNYNFQVDVEDIKIKKGGVDHSTSLDDLKFNFQIKHSTISTEDGTFADAVSKTYDPVVADHYVGIKLTWNITEAEFNAGNFDELQGAVLSFTTSFSLIKK